METAKTTARINPNAPLTPKAARVLAQLENLKRMARELGINSNRTQKNLLLSLSDEELATVAGELAELEKLAYAAVNARPTQQARLNGAAALSGLAEVK